MAQKCKFPSWFLRRNPLYWVFGLNPMYSQYFWGSKDLKKMILSCGQLFQTQTIHCCISNGPGASWLKSTVHPCKGKKNEAMAESRCFAFVFRQPKKNIFTQRWWFVVQVAVVFDSDSDQKKINQQSNLQLLHVQKHMATRCFMFFLLEQHLPQIQLEICQQLRIPIWHSFSGYCRMI